MYLEIYDIETAYFLTAPVLAWQGALEKTNIKLDLLADIDVLLIVEKSISCGICHGTH